MQNFVFLTTSGLYITGDISHQLLAMAHAMIDGKQSMGRIKTRSIEGKITTTFKTVMLGHFGGLQFDATLEANGKTYPVHYIVDPENRLDPNHAVLHFPFHQNPANANDLN